MFLFFSAQNIILEYDAREAEHTNFHMFYICCDNSTLCMYTYRKLIIQQKRVMQYPR
jgi:hypothetical protein